MLHMRLHCVVMLHNTQHNVSSTLIEGPSIPSVLEASTVVIITPQDVPVLRVWPCINLP